MVGTIPIGQLSEVGRHALANLEAKYPATAGSNSPGAVAISIVARTCRQCESGPESEPVIFYKYVFDLVRSDVAL